jgi:glycosyltransferase involved in cell wall biosynthesis
VLHVAQIGVLTDLAGREPARLLREWPSLVDVAECAAHCDIRVSVIQSCVHSQSLTVNGVNYYFLPFGQGRASRGQTRSFGRLLRDLDPDVIHVHGLGFPRDVLMLAKRAPGVPIVVQDHASRPPRIWSRPLWRRALRAVAGAAFTGTAQAEPFQAAGLFHPQLQIFDIPESSSRFSPGDRAQARQITGLAGDPCVLWVGHLNDNKDPLAVLDGVSLAARARPELQLWCYFGSAPLLSEVRRRIECDPFLRERVHLQGAVSHATIEHLMRAADLFVLGSHCEGSGYSLIEALACGLPPIVTNIAPFRSLTCDGAIGRLWPCGDGVALCEAMLGLVARPQPQIRAAVRAHFETELSFDALGRKLHAMYDGLSRGKSASPRNE